MKIKELIEHLNKFDPELDIIINRYDGFNNHKDEFKEDALSFEYQITTYRGKKLELCLAID